MHDGKSTQIDVRVRRAVKRYLSIWASVGFGEKHTSEDETITHYVEGALTSASHGGEILKGRKRKDERLYVSLDRAGNIPALIDANFGDTLFSQYDEILKRLKEDGVDPEYLEMIQYLAGSSQDLASTFKSTDSEHDAKICIRDKGYLPTIGKGMVSDHIRTALDGRIMMDLMSFVVSNYLASFDLEATAGKAARLINEKTGKHPSDVEYTEIVKQLEEMQKTRREHNAELLLEYCERLDVLFPEKVRVWQEMKLKTQANEQSHREHAQPSPPPETFDRLREEASRGTQQNHS